MILLQIYYTKEGVKMKNKQIILNFNSSLTCSCLLFLFLAVLAIISPLYISYLKNKTKARYSLLL